MPGHSFWQLGSTNRVFANLDILSGSQPVVTLCTVKTIHEVVIVKFVVHLHLVVTTSYEKNMFSFTDQDSRCCHSLVLHQGYRSAVEAQDFIAINNRQYKVCHQVIAATTLHHGLAFDQGSKRFSHMFVPIRKHICNLWQAQLISAYIPS